MDYTYDPNESIEKRLERVKEFVDEFKVLFPYNLDDIRGKAFSPIPGRASALAAVLSCRMSELSEMAHQMMIANRVVPSGILARSAFETACLQFYLTIQVQESIATQKVGEKEGEIGHTLMRALFGSKVKIIKLSESFDAINVLTTLKHVEREFSGATMHYENLCEIAHPNLMGVHVGYGMMSDDGLLHVNATNSPPMAKTIISALLFSQIMFKLQYQHLREAMVDFVKLCDGKHVPPA